MKRYLFGVFALALAIGFTAFTSPAFRANRFLQFTPVAGSTSEVLQSNYTDVGTTAPAACNNINVKVCWIAVNDADASGTISALEFQNGVSSKDTDSDTFIADQLAPVAGLYSEKN